MSITAVHLIQRLHQHRSWVNGKLLVAAAELTDEQLRRIFPIGQGSVWKSLLHLYGERHVNRIFMSTIRPATMAGWIKTLRPLQNQIRL